jgi:riboflavin biosynthesis pyrimidine reductase
MARADMVTTLDGAATGGDGLTGSIDNPADRRVFHVLREMSDAIVVGAGTARSERHVPAVRPLVVASRLGVLPQGLAGAEPGSVLMATHRGAKGLAASRRQLGEDNVLLLGEDTVDLTQLRPQLAG